MENILRLYNQKRQREMPQRYELLFKRFASFFNYGKLFSHKATGDAVSDVSLQRKISGIFLSRHSIFYDERARRFQQMSKSISPQPATTRPSSGV